MTDAKPDLLQALCSAYASHQHDLQYGSRAEVAASLKLLNQARQAIEARDAQLSAERDALKAEVERLKAIVHAKEKQ
jgi:hypothetical protein